MKGYYIAIDLGGETTGYLKNKEQGDKREVITPHFDLAGYWTSDKAQRVSDQWQKRGYKTSIRIKDV